MGQTSEDSTKYNVVKTDDDWKKLLTPIQFQVTRKSATERPFTGEFNKHSKKGKYLCVCCGEFLFESDTKFESGCGWPSFFDAQSKEKIEYIRDTSHGMERTEVRCKNCGAHLGHVFKDGPPPTGLRYCINSASLKFEEE